MRSARETMRRYFDCGSPRGSATALDIADNDNTYLKSVELDVSISMSQALDHTLDGFLWAILVA
jgi:hypothetical protein